MCMNMLNVNDFIGMCNVQNMGKQLIYRDGLDNIRNTVCMSMMYVSAEIW